jgi:hypothetical protein
MVGKYIDELIQNAIDNGATIEEDVEVDAWVYDEKELYGIRKEKRIGTVIKLNGNVIHYIK